MAKGRKVVSLVMVCVLSFVAGCSRSEEVAMLDKLVARVTERQSYTEKKKKQFTERLQSYYFEKVPVEEIERLMKEQTAGIALASVAFAVVAKVSPVEVAAMKQKGRQWDAVAKAVNANLSDVVKEVKEFRKAIG